ncbi:unnamed protein product [Cuscuta europaea]|uniref:S-acyltransferase n=1 Tax=Cuscuta europaea TaxID=41803 RepID=A0A9P0ZWR2_CUSEU|nr:unnamed protein product [Cuscuta europaea]
MRKHGWQLPYHPLQVVAVAVFMALSVAFYVFFAPFVGKKLFQYIVMGIYTPLIMSVFGLYICCAATDPADRGVFKSKKYLKIPDHKKHFQTKDFKLGTESTSSVLDGEKSFNKKSKAQAAANHLDQSVEKSEDSSHPTVCSSMLLPLLPCASRCCSNRCEEPSDLQTSEDGMFYCSLCEVEVFRYSKHCRVCDKCVDRFDHHCRWLNNCVGKRNYRKFFTLMVSALLLLILQWSTGILVLILCFVEKKRFSVDITSKLGSSFSVVPYVMVVAVCTILAMLATLPLAQLFFFHILLIKKGISTYDYIMALREQEQGIGGQQSPQMSTVSSLTGLSSSSSFNTYHQAAWCTPPRLFLEDQYDVVPLDNGSVSSLGKKIASEEPVKKKRNPAAVKISPWTLARLNGEDVAKAAAEARKKSKILQPVVRQQQALYDLDGEANISYGLQKPENKKRRPSKRAGLAPLHLEARTTFHTNRGSISSSGGIVASSLESSLDNSPDIRPFRRSSSGAEEGRDSVGLSTSRMMTAHKGIPFSRSTSDGYDASGGEDSDQVPSRFVERPKDWSSLLFGSDQNERISTLVKPSSSTLDNNRML